MEVETPSANADPTPNLFVLRKLALRRAWPEGDGRDLQPTLFGGHRWRTPTSAARTPALLVLALVLVIVGALNWGLVALFEWDLVAELFGETFGTTKVATRIIYGLLGLDGLYLAVTVLPAILRSDSRLAFGERRTV